MSGADLTEEEFRALLAENNLKLESKALDAALQGARHLRAEIARIDAYLAETEART